MEMCGKEVALGLVFHDAQRSSGGSQGVFHLSRSVWLYAELLLLWSLSLVLEKLSVLKSWNAGLKYFSALILVTRKSPSASDADLSAVTEVLSHLSEVPCQGKPELLEGC